MRQSGLRPAKGYIESSTIRWDINGPRERQFGLRPWAKAGQSALAYTQRVSPDPFYLVFIYID